MIDLFDGEYAFLSNFYPAIVEFEGLIYFSSEAAYQAAKTIDLSKRMVFTQLDAGQSKRAGRKLELRPDWDRIKNQVMYEICYNKFVGERSLMRQLVLTHPHELVEGNTWGDRYWGVCNGQGENHLGKILMLIRESHILLDLEKINQQTL